MNTTAAAAFSASKERGDETMQSFISLLPRQLTHLLHIQIYYEIMKQSNKSEDII